MVDREEISRLLGGNRFEIKEILNAAKDDSQALKMAKKRAEGYPLQYIIGEWEFMSLPFKVCPGVLIPRQDTETLVEHAIKLIGDKKCRVLDLCCGSGCIGISVAHYCKNTEVYSVDIDDIPIKTTEENAELNSVKINIIKDNALDPKKLAELPKFDFIICNPPYLTKEDMENLQLEVKSEPELALFGGDDGLEFYRVISDKYSSILKPEGSLIFEIGASQGEDVKTLMKQRFKGVEILKDLTGNNRIVSGILI